MNIEKIKLGEHWGGTREVTDLKGDKVVARVASSELAEEAIRRWNCHTQLIEALENALGFVQSWADTEDASDDEDMPATEAVKQIKAALAAAKGEVG